MLSMKNLKKIRYKLDLKQSEVAELLGVTRGCYSLWETDYEIIPIKKLLKFCEVFNVSLDYVLGLSDLDKDVTSKFNLEESKKRLKYTRKINEYTQIKLAQYLNTDSTVISNFETGKYIISTPFLYMICKKFQVSADYLMGRDV